MQHNLWWLGFFFIPHFFSSSIFADETMCGDPEQPLYSTIQRLSDQSIVYACLKGYKMEAGDPRRDCVNGVWTGPPPPRCSGPIDPPLLFIFYSLMLTRRRNEVVVGKKGRKGTGRAVAGRSQGRNSCDLATPYSCPNLFDARKKSKVLNNVASTMPHTLGSLNVFS